jgi:superfamily II DNA or RNA helicase
MGLILRDYQEELVVAVRESVMAGNRRVLMVGSTGLGKTAILFDISRRAVEKGGKVLLLVHRRDLAFQTAKKFEEYGMRPGILMSGVDTDLDNPIQICSVWTYRNRLKLAPEDVNKFYINASLILLDECHKSLSPVFKEVMAKYNAKVAIGVTATPCLSSGAAMSAMYDDLVDVVPISRLIEEKYLVDCIYYGGSSPDMTGVKTVLGDWDKKELGKRSDTPELIGDIVKNWFRLASDRQTIVFAVNRKHGRHLCDSFLKKGVVAEYLDAHSTDEERADILRRFNSSEVQMIINVALFQEFLDSPIMSCVVMARKTKSLGLWRQCIGRGLRPHPESGKTECLVIDHGSGVRTLGMISDDIEWTLEGKKGYKKKKQAKKEKPPLECSECRHIFKGKVCPQCGLEVKNYGKKIEAIEAELQEITKGKSKKPKPTMEEKKKFMQMAEYYRRKKGYQPGYAAHLFKSKYGVWPNRFKDVSPIEPDRGFNNYLKHRAIAYHKRQEKKAA